MASIQTATKIKMISDALVLCGEKPLNSLSDNRYGATVGANLFELLYENELQTNRWRFNCTKKQLSRLTASPLNEWQYAFQKPSDCLLPVGSYPRVNYEIYGNHIYTNQATFALEYQFKPDVSELPAYFNLLMVYDLAQNMIKPITESDTAVTLMNKAYARQRALAQFADAQARPNKPIVDSPFTDIR